MLKTLSDIAKILHSEKLTWAVGGSFLLHHYNLIENPNDIDIIVDEKDAPLLNEMLSPLGTRKEAEKREPFHTVTFTKYKMNQTDFDIMGGFAIGHEEGIYKLVFTEESVVDSKNINGVEVPLCALEDWYVFYWLLPNKQEKAYLIENYFLSNGVKHPKLLKRALTQPLPQAVKERINKLNS
ncbi:nucleotidyltransferase domain-containing protein [Fredinandcohnia humi]